MHGRVRPPRTGFLRKRGAGGGHAPHPPGAQPPRPQAHKHRADQLPEGRGVHRVQLVLLAVPKVVVVQGASGETDPFGGLVII